MGTWTREMFTKDLVFEVLIRMHTGASESDALHAVMGRRPEYEELRAFADKVTLMHNGWVRMDANLRPWMEDNRLKEKP